MGMWVQEISLGMHNLGGNAKIVGNQCCNAENEGGNLIIAVEMTQNSNENDKFKE